MIVWLQRAQGLGAHSNHTSHELESLTQVTYFQCTGEIFTGLLLCTEHCARAETGCSLQLTGLLSQFIPFQLILAGNRECSRSFKLRGMNLGNCSYRDGRAGKKQWTEQEHKNLLPLLQVREKEKQGKLPEPKTPVKVSTHRRAIPNARNATGSREGKNTLGLPPPLYNIMFLVLIG